MKNFASLIAAIILLLLPIVASAQNGLNSTYTCVVMQEKKYIGGIGVKIGAPMALTYKMYFLKRFAFEATAGISNTSVSDEFLVEKFDEITTIDFAGAELNTIEYFMHSVEGIYAAQARVMMHNPIPRALSGRGFENLDWYIGLGAVIRIIDVKYLYQYQETQNVENVKSFREQIEEYGPEWMFGFEYAFKDVPLAAFAEMGMFFRINEKEPFHAIQGGLGVRYVF